MADPQAAQAGLNLVPSFDPQPKAQVFSAFDSHRRLRLRLRVKQLKAARYPVRLAKRDNRTAQWL